MNRILPVLFIVLTVALIAAGSVHKSSTAPASTPEGAVQAMFNNVKARNWNGAYTYIAGASHVDLQNFQRDLQGRDSSLRSYSQLENLDTRVLHESESDALVRAELKYATAVGAYYDTRDLKVMKDEGSWKVNWQTEKEASVPPQVIPVNYLRWDVIWRGQGDDWGAQNVDGPRIRILSAHYAERDGAVIVMGEVVNEDTVPAFVSVGAYMLDKNGQDVGYESSFDKVSHILLPKEV